MSAPGCHSSLSIVGTLTVVDGLVARLGTCVQQDADLGVELLANSVEKPPVRVDLFRVFLLQAENDLDRHLVR